jgi:rhodanese-related sulfurtransferase
MKKIIIAAVLLVSILSWSQMTIVESTNHVEQTGKTVKRVSKKEFKEKLAELKDVQLIDVRTPGEFKQGTIEGARNIDFRSEDFETEISKLDKSKPVMIFCQAGGRSARALNQFEDLGFTFVLELEGGYGNWK